MNTILSILDAALHGGSIEPVAPEMWAEVYPELVKHSVQCVPAALINQLGLTPEAKREYSLAVDECLSGFYDVMLEQQRVLECVSDIPAVVMRGAAAAMYYPHPKYRGPADIDIIAHRDDFMKVYEFLLKEGYRLKSESGGDDRYAGFTDEGAVIKLHRCFSAGRFSGLSTILDGHIYEGIRTRRMANVNGFSVPVLPRLENGLVLLENIRQRLYGGITLRQIVDWMCYVEAELDDAFWLEAFSRAAGATGLRQLAVVAAAMCKRYLGLTGVTWCDGADSGACEELMSFVLNYGSFVGKKHINPFRSLKAAQKYGRASWKLLERRPYLRPFAWIYQIKRWISKGRRRWTEVKSTKEILRREIMETELFEKLGIMKK